MRRFTWFKPGALRPAQITLADTPPTDADTGLASGNDCVSMKPASEEGFVGPKPVP
jgi:hypothetical protein